MASSRQDSPARAGEATADNALIRSAEIERFLQLYSPALDFTDAGLAIFRLPHRKTFASRDIRALTNKAARWATERSDVYVHIHLHELAEGEGHHRGSIETARAAIGLFADIDARGPGRKKSSKTLCPTVADALWITEEFDRRHAPLRTSLIIASGHGCYPAVLLKEPLVISTQEDRQLLDSLSRRFHQALNEIASQKGWTGAVDFADIAKVLRLPGCANYKDPNHPRRVELVRETPARFTTTDLDDLLPPLQASYKSRTTSGANSGADAHGSEITLNPTAEVSEDLIAALAANHPLFLRTWTHQRSDLYDSSCSGYDLALAGIGVACGLADQLIADLLVVHRRQFAGNKKIRRGSSYLKYLRRTIRKAHGGTQPGDSATPDSRAQCEDNEGPAEGGAEEPKCDANPKDDTEPTDGDGEPASGKAHSGEDRTTGDAGESPNETQEAPAPDRDPPHPYREKNGRIVRVKVSKDGAEEVIPLTNFTAKITANIGEDDGVELKRFFGIEANLVGQSYAFTVPANRFASMEWPIEQIGPTAIVHPNQKEWARAAVQSLSDHVIDRRIYTHTGWRRIGERMVYLHGGGAIGASGVIADIDVRLSGALVHYALILPDSGEQLIDAVRASLHVLDVAPDHISFPILAAVYRASLKSCDFAVWLGGPTGVFKSELAALAQQHYGAAMNARRLPANFASTGNSLEALAFATKDALLVIDDFAPHGSFQDVSRYHAAADRVLRAAGNNQGRARLSSDARLREAKAPRGLILATGEDMPRGQSIRGRTLIVEVAPGDVRTGVLTGCQVAGAGGAYARSMGAFVQSTAARHEDVQADLQARVLELRSQAARAHSRTPGIVADLHAGFELFVAFATTVDAITSSEQKALEDRCWAALNKVARAQRAQQEASEPTQRFLDLLRAAILSGQAHLANPRGGAPGHDGEWGWQLIGSGDHERLVSRGKCVGWLDRDDLYLEPNASFGVAQDLGRATGEPLVVGQTTLNKRLREKGFLASIDEKRGTLTVRRRIGGESIPVLHMPSEVLASPAEFVADRAEVFEC